MDIPPIIDESLYMNKYNMEDLFNQVRNIIETLLDLFNQKERDKIMT